MHRIHQNRYTWKIWVIGIQLYTNFFLLSFSQAGLNIWTQGLGTDGWDAGNLTIDPIEPRRVYGAGIGGQIFRTLDYGSTWSININPISAVANLAINPLSNNQIFAGLSDSFTMSTDFGLNWEIRSLETHTSGDDIALHMGNVNRIYQAGFIFSDPLSRSFVISTDQGYNWFGTIPRNIMHSTEDIELVPNQPNKLYLGTNADIGTLHGIFISTDSGLTWSYHSTGLPPAQYFVVRVHPIETNKVYTGANNGILYHSMDEGESWFSITTSFGYLITGIEIDAMHPYIMYLSTLGNGVFKSNDYGDTWTPLNNGLLDLRVMSLAFDSINRNLYIGTSTTNPDFPAHGIWVYQDTDTSLPPTAIEPKHWQLFQ